MRTLHLGLRVADLERSLAFYGALGYEVVGRVPETELGHLTMLKLPGDEFVAIELVSGPPDVAQGPGDRLSHVVVQVESMDAAVARLSGHDVAIQTHGAPGDAGVFFTAWVTDPDGNRIELVQWPEGHLDGMSAADFPAEEAAG